MENNKKFDLEAENAELKMRQEQESSFDIKTIFALFILNWQWFALSMFIFVCGALLYLRYTSPVYQVSAKMLIKDEQNNRRSANQMLANMQDFGFMTNSAGIENEVEILQSKLLAIEAVKDLKLYTEYRAKGRIKKVLTYKTQPINVDIDKEHLDILDATRSSFTILVTKDGENYKVEEINGRFTGNFTTLPAALETPYGTLTFTKNVLPERERLKLKGIMTSNKSNMEEEPEADRSWAYYVTFRSPEYVASGYAASLSVAPTSKLTSIAELSLKDFNAERAYDYLKQLAIVYNRQANADKNEIAYKTEEFINSRLEKINAELGATESELESYKRNNNLTQLRLDATQTMTQANQYYSQLVNATTQLQILDELRKHIDDPANRYQIIPSNVGLSDAASSSLIASYNKTVLERNRLLAAASETSPLVMAQTNMLDQLESSIREALKQARRTADISRQGVEKQYNEFQSRVASTPEQERILTQIGRQQEVKSGLYLMLLQKREENSISLAATADKGRLIDDPVYGGKVSPKNSIILLAAIVLGFGLPLLIAYIISLLRYKIEGHEDVTKLTTLPIVADVAVANEEAKNAAGIVVKENKNNQIDEIFRSMRTNIQFMMKEDDKVILFTSSTSGEGKTFNAANLAASFAFLGKKVILLGLDIRKPALGRLFQITDRSAGISVLLTKDKVTEADLKSQIKPSGVSTNLDLLLAGPTPPNPAELLARQNLKDIIDMLRQQYDYIILDTAPVGLVTDTLAIGKHTDVSVFVCRADYTPKDSFNLINELHAQNKMPNMCIVINGIDMSKKKYGYYYGYGRYGKYGRYGRYGRYGNYGNYGSYGNYAESHYGNKDDNTIKK
ncbi:MAG: polysaccharide biosynthesis tyrosine autokinase [Prevotella sp.]|nr:polysaccharide biosynthesis tyrosine autokinase [Prevotella sp.]